MDMRNHRAGHPRNPGSAPGLDGDTRIALRIATDMETLHQRKGDGVSDELGISISHLAEQFRHLANTWHKPA